MNMDSVLESVKKMLDIDPDYDAFDPELIIHINSALGVAKQVGVQLNPDFIIYDSSKTWSEVVQDPEAIPLVKSYIYLKVKLIFDPPNTGVLHEAMERQIQEFEWRLFVDADPVEEGSLWD